MGINVKHTTTPKHFEASPIVPNDTESQEQTHLTAIVACIRRIAEDFDLLAALLEDAAQDE